MLTPEPRTKAFLHDLTNDGLLDIVTLKEYTLSVGIQTATDQFRWAKVDHQVQTDNPLVFGDFNGDRRPDILYHSIARGNRGFRILPGEGDGSFGDASALLDGPPFIRAEVEDLNRDGKDDLVLATWKGTKTLLLLSQNEGFSQIESSVPRLNLNMTLLDLDGDSQLDLVGSSDTSVIVAWGDKNGNFLEGFSDPSFTGNYCVVSGDFDGDGLVDLVSVGSGFFRVIWNKGERILEATPKTESLILSKSMRGIDAEGVSADLNGDGKSDLMLATGKTLLRLDSSGDGKFTVTGRAETLPGAENIVFDNAGVDVYLFGRGAAAQRVGDLPPP